MIRELLARVWELPWPAAMRRPVQKVVSQPGIRAVLFPQFMVGVVGIIENERNEYLLLRHTYRGDTPWGLPTGFLEHAEQPADALKREILEEAGMVVDLTPVWHVYVDGARPLVNLVYRGAYRSGAFVPSTEISESDFVSIDRLPPLLPGQRGLLESAHAEEVPH